VVVAMLELPSPQRASEWCDARRARGESIGYVPTMGALHAGHLSLVARAVQENAAACASIFVNPLQFNDRADLRDYPRDWASDAAALANAGCRMLFTGELADFFPGDDGVGDGDINLRHPRSLLSGGGDGHGDGDLPHRYPRSLLSGGGDGHGDGHGGDDGDGHGDGVGGGDGDLPHRHPRSLLSGGGVGHGDGHGGDDGDGHGGGVGDGDRDDGIDPGPGALGLEGDSRPGHLQGVARIVERLFAAVGPCRAYFGEKDFQQTLVVRHIARRLPGVEVRVCPTVRDADGLALSSRNRRLSPAGRAAALQLHQALLAARAAWQSGQRHPAALESVMRARLTHPDITVDYTAIRDATTWQTGPLKTPRALIAATITGTRLIDNLALD